MIIERYRFGYGLPFASVARVAFPSLCALCCNTRGSAAQPFQGYELINRRVRVGPVGPSFITHES